MDPATILILLGAFYAIKSGVKGVRLASAAAGRAPAARSGSGGSGGGKSGSKKPGGGMPAWLNHQRHTGAGWWAGEIRHGFPVFRAGTREGWTRHQTAMAQRQAAVAKTRADHTERQQTYRQERDGHRARLADLERQERESKARAAKAAAATAPAPAGAAGWRGSSAGTPPGGTAHGGSSGSPGVMAPPAPQPGCTDQNCRCHSTGRGSQPAAPAGSAPTNGQAPAQPSASPSTGGTVTDSSYTQTQETCTKIQAALEAAMNDEQLTAAEQLCDGLGPALPDDTETLGHAGDLVSAIKEARAAMARASEQAEALRASHEKNHGAANEAAQATGHMAEREHHVNA